MRNMPNSLFSDLPTIQPDEGFPLLAAFESDTSNKKVSLGAGVYRDEDEHIINLSYWRCNKEESRLPHSDLDVN